jgi:hypothetical protein
MATLDLSEYVRVTNHTGAVIKGRYDGTEYVFKIGEPTDIHNLAATHIFGFGQDDKTNAFHRLGRLAGDDNYEMAMEWLRDIEFGEVPSPAIDIKAGAERRANKTGSPTPLVDAGAEDGAAVPAAPADASKGKGSRGVL